MTDSTALGEAAYDSMRESAEAIRQFNHHTLNAEQMPLHQINSCVRSLLDVVDRLPQALDQLASHLAKQQANGKIRMEDGSDPALAVARAASGLLRAAAMALPKGYNHPDDEAGDFSGAVHDAASWIYNMAAVYTPDDFNGDD